MNRYGKIALGCGLFPLATGSLIFIAWWVTRAETLMIAGVGNLYLGLILFSTGLTFLFLYVYHARRVPKKDYKIKAGLILFVLLMNFPVAHGIIRSVSYIQNTSVVRIKNQTNTAIESLSLIERGKVYKIGVLGPLQMLEREFHFLSEGSIQYRFFRKKSKVEGILIPYVTQGFGRNSELTITDANEVVIND